MLVYRLGNKLEMDLTNKFISYLGCTDAARDPAHPRPLRWDVGGMPQTECPCRVLSHRATWISRLAPMRLKSGQLGPYRPKSPKWPVQAETAESGRNSKKKKKKKGAKRTIWTY